MHFASSVPPPHISANAPALLLCPYRVDQHSHLALLLALQVLLTDVGSCPGLPCTGRQPNNNILALQGWLNYVPLIITQLHTATVLRAGNVWRIVTAKSAPDWLHNPLSQGVYFFTAYKAFCLAHSVILHSIQTPDHGPYPALQRILSSLRGSPASLS